MTRSAYVWIPVLIGATVAIDIGRQLKTNNYLDAFGGFSPDSPIVDNLRVAATWTLEIVRWGPACLATLWLAWGASALSLRVLGVSVVGIASAWWTDMLEGIDVTLVLLVYAPVLLLGVVVLMPPWRQRLLRVSRRGGVLEEQSFPWRFSVRQLLLVTAIVAVVSSLLRPEKMDRGWGWDAEQMLSSVALGLPVVPVCWIALRPRFSLGKSLALSIVVTWFAALVVTLGLLLELESTATTWRELISNHWPLFWICGSFVGGVTLYAWLAALIVRQMGYRVARSEAIVPTATAERVASLAA